MSKELYPELYTELEKAFPSNENKFAIRLIVLDSKTQAYMLKIKKEGQYYPVVFDSVIRMYNTFNQGIEFFQTTEEAMDFALSNIQRGTGFDVVALPTKEATRFKFAEITH